ncbi:hypothetical protein C6Y62_11770 [Hyphomicrobium sulfonivorans]|nr:hypothetical protein [Hyphomicrobium sulfonivorans]
MAIRTDTGAAMRRVGGNANLTGMFALMVALGAAAPALAQDNACLPANGEGQIAQGQLTIRDGAIILKLPQAVCLTGADEDDNVDATDEIHVAPMDEDMQQALTGLVGRDVKVRGTMIPAHTQHHKAPIVLMLEQVAPL